MIKKIYELITIRRAKNPNLYVLSIIVLVNIVFFLGSAFLIRWLSLEGTENMSFWHAFYYTVTMILDAGCITNVIEDIGKASVVLAITCLCVVVIGIIMFTGAVIGYITNWISGYIDKSNAGEMKLSVSDHVVILNWNNRASEIVNDLLYCPDKKTVVVLCEANKEDIEREIHERLSDTVARENAAIREKYKNDMMLKRLFMRLRHHFRNKVTVIVREGDIFSSKQLRDISLENAQMVIILGNDTNNSVCKFEQIEKQEKSYSGNSQTVKTLMQVADITGAEYSADGQKIIVEISDDWTAELVNKVIKAKEVNGKCSIVPLPINQVLGQLLSQFSIMPELNYVYNELFSNKGLAFYTKEATERDDTKFIGDYLKNHAHSIPLTVMDYDDKHYGVFSCNDDKDIDVEEEVEWTDKKFAYNGNFKMDKKNVIILGHNSKCENIMLGFQSFCNEWAPDDPSRVLSITVIDDDKYLKKVNYYEKYDFVTKVTPAEIYDKDVICDALNDFFNDNNTSHVSVLVLSDDTALNEDIDANALANLIYVQDIISEKEKNEDDIFKAKYVDIIVEIIDPKHYDIVNSYSTKNVVISNRYISKLVTQIGEKEELYTFFTDILTYDDENVSSFESKEIYIKKVNRFFTETPGECTIAELIRGVFTASIDPSVPEEYRYPVVPIGYVKKEDGSMVLFGGDQRDQKIRLDPKDKLIVFAYH